MGRHEGLAAEVLASGGGAGGSSGGVAVVWHAHGGAAVEARWSDVLGAAWNAADATELRWIVGEDDTIAAELDRRVGVRNLVLRGWEARGDLN